MKKYIKLLTPEQEGMINDLIVALAKAERNNKELYAKGIAVSMHSDQGSVSAFGKWIPDKDNFLGDILLIKLGGLTTDRRPEQKNEEDTLPDKKTVIVGRGVVDLNED